MWIVTKRTIIVLAIIIATIFFVFKKCSIDNMDRENLRRTTKICDNLYVETFCVFGQGAFGGDLDSDWLTDKKNFLIYVGTYDEVNGGISFKCSGDSVYVKQRPDATADSPKGGPVTKVYNINDLKKKQNFNDY